MGYSSSTASSNIAGVSTGTSVREAAPRASCCSRKPSWPRRSLKAISGSAASARKLRTPQRSKVSSSVSCGQVLFLISLLFFFRSMANKTSTGRDPNDSLSFPGGITVTPENPRAASTAASGFEATATFPSSPSSAARRKRLRAISGSEPKRDSMPARSRITVSAAASSTHGENDCAQSSRTACATDSCSGERGRSVNFGT